VRRLNPLRRSCGAATVAIVVDALDVGIHGRQAAAIMMCSIVQVLREWQDLAGAIIGGMLGVFGALIVAGSVATRERRSASRMVQRDLVSVTAMVDNLTYNRQVPLAALGDQLIGKLTFSRHHLSSMFEAQMSIMFGSDRILAGLLAGFHQHYSLTEYFVGNIERARTMVPPDPQAAAREREQLPAMLKGADEYAQAALYLLYLEEMGTLLRARERLRRRFRPTQDDKDARVLVDRLMSG
jgi:hypothetical protein